MEITILGSGTSHGIPVIGCSCEVCLSKSKRDKRLRSSLLIKKDGFHLLIDAGPDFRFQALKNNIHSLDLVLITHSHNDHIGGLDDLRPLTVTKPLRVGAQKDTVKDIRTRYDYFYREQKEGGGIPRLEIFEIGSNPFSAGPLDISPISVFHGSTPIFGFRIESMAYLTDLTSINQAEKEKLMGLNLLILGVLRERAHPTHMNLDQALSLVNELKPERTYFIHICHEVSHHDWAKKMPPNIQPGWDGLVLRTQKP